MLTRRRKPTIRAFSTASTAVELDRVMPPPVVYPLPVHSVAPVTASAAAGPVAATAASEPEFIDDLCLNLIATTHLQAIQGMVAGGVYATQTARLMAINAILMRLRSISAKNITTVTTTDSLEKEQKTSTIHHDLWNNLFRIIKSSKELSVKTSYAKRIINLLLRAEDPLLLAVYEVHSVDFIELLIKSCCASTAKELQPVDGEDTDSSEALVTNTTFECIIKELLLIIEKNHRFTFNVGLPSHHASRATAEGYCVINKIAVLLAYYRRKYPNLTFVVFDTDVNAGDGLPKIIFSEPHDSHVVMIDVFDSRVYPYNRYRAFPSRVIDIIHRELSTIAPEIEKTVELDHVKWTLGNRIYLVFDLAKNPRLNPGELHPAIHFVTTKITDAIIGAQEASRQVGLFHAMGFDSHCKERAVCSAFDLTTTAIRRGLDRESFRFNDTDMLELYQRLVAIFTNPVFARNILFGVTTLEGGYTPLMLKQQLTQWVATFASLSAMTKVQVTLPLSTGQRRSRSPVLAIAPVIQQESTIDARDGSGEATSTSVDGTHRPGTTKMRRVVG